MNTPLSTAPVTADPAEGSGSELSPLAIWMSIRKRWLLVAAITVAVGVGVSFYTLGQTKVYETQVTVLFDPQQPHPLGDRVQTVLDTGQGYWSNKEYYRTQVWIIQSRRIASEVVRSLGLNTDAAFLANLPSGTAAAPRQASIEDAAAILQQRLSVDPIRDSRLALIKYQDSDPERARKILSALVETYVQRNLDDIMESSGSSADWLRGQLGSLKDEVENSELRLHEYKRDKNILSVSMDDQTNMLRDEMKALSDALTEVQRKREEVRARKEQLSKVQPENPMNVPATELMGSPMLQTLRDQYVATLEQIDSLAAAGKGENHPDVRSQLGKRESARQAFYAEVENIRGAVNSDLAELEHQMSGLKALFDAAEKRAFDINLLEIEYNRLARARDNSEKLYTLVMERSKESDLTRTMVFNNIRIMERPVRPNSPVSPNVPLNIASGLIAGLVLGLVAAIGREQLDRTVKTPDDAERALGLSFLGLLPSMAEGGASKPRYGRQGRQTKIPDVPTSPPELIVHEHPTSGIAEAARAIRTNILFMSPDHPYRTLLVTSAGPSEGKTTVACCIAIAMAQAGRRVVLVDCDMRRPRLHKIFGRVKETGITTALIDSPQFDELAVETPVPNLSIVTTGPLPPNPAEILHSEAFARLLAALKERFDCVVLDSPPIVPVTDAAVLSAAVDGTILVVRAFQTTKDLARRARRALQDVGGRVVGIVLNAVDLDRHEYGYRYYYYYKREGYAGEQVAGSSEDGGASADPS